MKIRPVQAIKRLKTEVHLTHSGKALVLSMGFVLLASVIIPALGVFSCLAAMLICSVSVIRLICSYASECNAIVSALVYVAVFIKCPPCG